MNDLNLLEGYAPMKAFCQGIGVTERTGRRYAKQPDGLPTTEIGGRLYVFVESGKAWLRRRERQPNPRRGRGA